jgi:DNA-binding LacI/PurR family transcriptional regulator
MQQKLKRITIRTVAADAGVSVAAVSKVLRDAYGVSAELRAKVHTSVQKLGYRPRLAARAMRGRSYTLGVLLPDIRNPFFSDILDGLNTALIRTQYQPVLAVSPSATIEQALVDSMLDRQIDGIIVLGPRMAPSEASALAARVPTVFIAYHEPKTTSFDTVNNDDQMGAALVVNHLATTGRRKIAFLSLDLPAHGDLMVTGQREIGYRAAMKSAGFAEHINVVRAEQTSREVQIAAKHMLQAREPPEAIFCWTDFIALEVVSVANELGLSIPDDLAIVGYDNTHYCDLAQNAVTSVDQSGQVLGLQSARLLVERVEGRTKAEHFLVTPRLVVRRSSQGPGR